LPVFRSFAWTWILGFALIALTAVAWLVRGAWPAPAPAADEGATAGRFPDLDAAWETVTLRLGQAGIILADQDIYLMLAPAAGASAAVVRSAGVQLFAQVSEESSPLHAFATADGVLLDCAWASRFGVANELGTARLEHLCRMLLRLDPERPVVRGVVVLFPVDWAADAGAAARAAAVREDLRAIQEMLRIRPPVFALFDRAEKLAGCPEFIARVPEPMRLSRCGFALPSSVRFSGDLVRRGLSWLSGWFDSWTGNLMAGDLLDAFANGRLYVLTREVRRRRRRWGDVMEAAFATHRESEPTPLRGCYLVASGEAPGDSAFTAGLLRGPRSRIMADAVLTDWTEEARRDDRAYRRTALVIGLVGGLLTLLAWAWIVRQHPLWWIGLLAVVLAWIATILRLATRA
jgi:type VI secretion system protein ImpL